MAVLGFESDSAPALLSALSSASWGGGGRCHGPADAGGGSPSPGGRSSALYCAANQWSLTPSFSSAAGPLPSCDDVAGSRLVRAAACSRHCTFKESAANNCIGGLDSRSLSSFRVPFFCLNCGTLGFQKRLRRRIPRAALRERIRPWLRSSARLSRVPVRNTKRLGLICVMSRRILSSRSSFPLPNLPPTRLPQPPRPSRRLPRHAPRRTLGGVGVSRRRDRVPGRGRPRARQALSLARPSPTAVWACPGDCGGDEEVDWGG